MSNRTPFLELESLRLTDAASIAGVTAETMKAWVLKGMVVGYRLPNGRLRVDKRDLEAKIQRVEPVA